MARAAKIALLTVMTLFLLASVVSAHATVSPKESTTNSYERYTLRVPTEKPQPTTKVRLLLPDGFVFGGVMPVAGWKYELEKSAANAVTAITWSGGEIAPNEFMEFGFNGRNPKDAATLPWKTYQTYKDGTVVEWTGAPGTDTPASVTEIKAPAAATPAPTTPTPAAPAPTPAPAPAAAAPATGGFLPIAAYGGLGLGVVAIILALAGRKR